MDEVIKISAVVITFNEEKNIGRCLKSLSVVADEIIVIDSFSTDRTELICNSFGVKFIKNPFNGHIEQKNFAIQQARFSYVLSLDADEVLSDILSQKIIEIKKNSRYEAYSFNRLTNYCGKWIRHCGWYPDVKIRLWHVDYGKWSGINPHDKVFLIKNARLKHIKGDLLHYSYYSINQHIAQLNYFTDIMAGEAYAQNKRTNLFYIITSPFFKFIKSYFFKLGILDGYYGFIVCMISAHATFIKHIKTKELFKKGVHDYI